MIHRDFTVNAPPGPARDAVKDVGAVHTRLARGFITDTALSDNARTVTFWNGRTIREQIITIGERLRCFSYAASGGGTSFRHALFADNGSAAMRQTLERSFKSE